MLNEELQPRAGWGPLWSYLNLSSRGELDYAHQQVQDELAEQAITAAPEDSSFEPIDNQQDRRSWALDSIPYVVDHSEWSWLSEQVQYRAQSINAIIADCYGERRLAQQDWFPRRLLAENPSFIRPLADGRQHGPFLNCYAVDLIRDQAGSWRVLADRCQAPFGLGYALQNRLVMGRSLTDVFEASKATSLAPFFRRLLGSLRSLSTQVQPRIALLSSSSLGDTSYEQAFMARYLDIDLVTAQDLTVRNRQVFTKTLGGLQPVDVLFRWVEDTWCDPLFLRGDSLAGVPGLVDAVASGNVVISNALGSGLMDTSAMLPLVHRCAEHLGYQAGGLDTVSVTWNERQLDLKPNHVLVRTWRDLKQQPVFINHLAESERQQWQQRVNQYPADYAMVEQVRTSRAPAWEDGHLNEHSIVLGYLPAMIPMGRITSCRVDWYDPHHVIGLLILACGKADRVKIVGSCAILTPIPLRRRPRYLPTARFAVEEIYYHRG